MALPGSFVPKIVKRKEKIGKRFNRFPQESGTLRIGGARSDQG
jgi:hypothetical protein